MTKTKRLNTRITDELKQKLQEYAEQSDRSESWVICEALKAYLEPVIRKPMPSSD